MTKVTGDGGAGQGSAAAAVCTCWRHFRDAQEEIEALESELMVVSVAAADAEVDIHDDVAAVCLRIRDRLRAVREGLADGDALRPEGS